MIWMQVVNYISNWTSNMRRNKIIGICLSEAILLNVILSQETIFECWQFHENGNKIMCLFFQLGMLINDLEVTLS